MSTMEQALREALADLLTEAGYMAQQLAHRGLPGVPGDSVDRAIASAKAALTAALPAPGVEAPGDWVMVPRVATAEMMRAFWLAGPYPEKPWQNGYAAMLAAAPSAPAEISQAQAQAMREALEKIVAQDWWAETLDASDAVDGKCAEIARAALAAAPEPPR